MPANYDAWKANINKYLEEKIGVNIEVEVVAWGDWQSRRSVIVNTAGDVRHILFTDMGTYASDVRLNAFADITETVQSAAPELYGMIPKDYWEACKIDGQDLRGPQPTRTALQHSILSGTGSCWISISWTFP